MFSKENKISFYIERHRNRQIYSILHLLNICLYLFVSIITFLSTFLTPLEFNKKNNLYFLKKKDRFFKIAKEYGWWLSERKKNN